MEHPYPLNISRTTTPLVGLLVACVLAGCSASPAPRPPQTGGPSPTPSAGPETDGEEMNLILTHPHTLTQGAEPKRLAAVWPGNGNSDDRICVWIDPVRSERSGE